MRRLKLGNKVLGGIEPPKQPTSEYKDDISRGKFEIIKNKEQVTQVATPLWVSTPISIYDDPRLDRIPDNPPGVVHLEPGQTVKGEKHFTWAVLNTIPIVSTVTPETDIRATNTIGPNFSRRQQKDVDE